MLPSSSIIETNNNITSLKNVAKEDLHDELILEFGKGHLHCREVKRYVHARRFHVDTHLK